MCYMTILSTTSELDLTLFNSHDVVFSKKLPGIAEEALLKYPNRWYLGSYQGCSCGFRHLMSCNYQDLGFHEPEDWFAEATEDIEATIKLVRIFKKIISDGSQLECIDTWRDGKQEAPPLAYYLDVDLGKLPEAAFRFIENSQHEFK